MQLKRENWDRTLVGYQWRDEENNMRGHTVDDLNKKQLSEAENLYEKVFILMRDEIASSCEYLCMDNEIDRLTLCQVLAGSLAKGGNFITKEGR